MNPAKRARLEAKGWKVSTVEEFLGLTEAEQREVERRLSEDEDNEPPEDVDD